MKNTQAMPLSIRPTSRTVYPKRSGSTTANGRNSTQKTIILPSSTGRHSQEWKTPYRRCTWTVKGKKKIVWRCHNRLDYGKKYCHESPTVEESVLHEAIMNAISRTAKENAELLKTLKLHIGMGLDMGESEDESLDLQIKIVNEK